MDFGKLPPPCLYGASPIMGGCLQLVVYYYFYTAPPHPHPQYQHNYSHAHMYCMLYAHAGTAQHNAPCCYYPAPAAVMYPMEML